MKKLGICFLFLLSAVLVTAQTVNFSETGVTEANSGCIDKFDIGGRVGEYNGRNVFFINGKVVPPVMYSGTEHSRLTWEAYPRENITNFYNHGYRLIQNDMWLKYIWKEDGTMDYGLVQRQLQGVLDAAPEAYIVIRINVSAPEWWIDDNPSELIQFAAGPTKKGYDHLNRGKRESYASQRWRLEMGEKLREFCVKVSNMEEGKRVVGVHIGGGVYGEWHYFSFRNTPDIGLRMTEYFRKWVKNKYKTVDNLQKAWHRSDIDDFTKITVPDFNERQKASDGTFRDPEKDMHYIDYTLAQADLTSDTVEYFAKIVKETWSRPVFTGVFYGYFYGGWTVGAAGGSQMNLERIFRSPYIDYFSGPYTSKTMWSGSGYYRSLADSVRLNGKIWVSEMDQASYLGSKGHPTKSPKDEKGSIAQMRRHYMHNIVEGSGQWWYDFGPYKSQKGGWWNTPAMLKEAQNLLELHKKMIEKPYVRGADILVVFDMNTYYYLADRGTQDAISGLAVKEVTETLFKTGVSFERIFLMDLDKVDMKNYKVVIFANTFKFTESEKRLIREKVLNGHRNILWMYAPGYTDTSRNDSAFISDITGIEVAKMPGRDLASIDVKGERISAKKLSPLFGVKDSTAKVIGKYDDGKIGAARKDMGDYVSWYFAIPVVNEKIFTDIFKTVGVKTYISGMDSGDRAAVGGGIIALVSEHGGKRIFHTNKAGDVVINVIARHTIYVDIDTGELLTAQQP